ncbi:hypothetical protein [Streptomyces salinarius]|uniref:Uncharacterized protein n=1 Tax=Streptomyces salinarius TaxID=2762598 RepID=A0ABW8BPP7_9ACTN
MVSDGLAVEHRDVGHRGEAETVTCVVVAHDAVQAPRVRERTGVDVGVDAVAGHVAYGAAAHDDVLDVALGLKAVDGRVNVSGAVEHQVVRV